MVTKEKTLVNKIMKGETSMSPRRPCLGVYKKQVRQSPNRCPQGLEKSAAFFLVFYILYGFVLKVLQMSGVACCCGVATKVEYKTLCVVENVARRCAEC